MNVLRVGFGLTGLALMLAVQQSAGVAPDQTAAALPPTTVEGQRAFVQTYCAGCHNERVKNGGFSWTELDVARPHLNAKRAEDVIRKVRAGLMPPAGARRPEAAALTAFSTALGTRLDETVAAAPTYKAPELHRMNRREYRNAVRDLLGLDIDVSALLPPDARTGSFDNMADALTINPALMQAYVRAADKVARQALGDPRTPPAQTKYDVPKRVNQMRHVEGTPLGTRGGVAVTHHFPADGDYSFQNELYFYYLGELIGGNLPEALQGQELEISIDGARVAAFTIDPLYEGNEGPLVTKPVRVTAGPHRVAAAFVAKADGAVEDSVRLVEQTIMDVSVGVHTGMSTLPHLMTMTVVGPMKAGGVSDTPSRRQILTCAPGAGTDERTCARTIATTLAKRAYRRAPAADEIDTLLSLYDAGRDGGTFDDGVRTIVQGVLTRPEFIFRFERVPETATAGQHYRINDLELASRLSYFLWGSVPDDTLIEAATNGQLKTPAGLERQVKRMLADPRAESLSTTFAAQWLRLTGLADVHPEPTIFPDFTKDLATAMRREVELLFDSLVREDRAITDLLTTDDTFVNEVLARHYGIPNVAGPTFRRAKLRDPNRFGLMGRGAILTQTSLANRTSPVARGKYVLEVIMGAPPPLPPPNVPPLAEQVNNAAVLTVRERMEAHRKNATCAACHKIMDPIGLALENFDATGKWRTKDGGASVDPRGDMYDGRSLDGPVSLREAIVSHADAFRSGFSESLLAYALGRVLDFTDMPTARAVARQGTRERDRFSAYVMAVVTSGPFQMRTLASATDTVAPVQPARGVH